MTQAYTKGAKRRNKGKRAMFQRLEAVQEAYRAATPDDEGDPREVVRQARSRMMGRKDGEALLSPMLCEEAGRALDIGAGRDAALLWAAFKAYDTSEHVYFARIIGRPRFPTVSKMEFMPERFEARADDKPDTRSDAQKIHDAANTWARWQGYLGHMNHWQRRAIIRAAWQMDELHKGGTLTVHGQTFVAAARSLADVVEQG